MPVFQQRRRRRVAVAASIFGEAVDRKIGALGKRLRPERSEERLVNRDRRLFVGSKGRVAGFTHSFDIDELICRVRGSFKVNKRNSPLAFRTPENLINLFTGRARRKVEPQGISKRPRYWNQCFGRRIERPGVNNHVSGLNEGEKQCRNRRHPARKG